MASVEELHNVLDDITGVYAEDGEDLRLVRAIRENQAELVEICQSKEDQLSRTLENLQLLVVKLREQSQVELSKDMILQEHSLLQQQRSLHEKITQLEEDLALQKSRVASVQDNLSHLNSRYEELSQQSNKEIPVCQRTLQLYKKIAPVEWNYNTADPKDVVGSLICTHSNRIVRINIPAEAGKSDFEIANTLWDMIDRDFEQPSASKSITLIR